MDEEKQIAIFLSEFDHQVGQIDGIYAKLKNKLHYLEAQSSSIEMVESAGYWLHNLYSGFEDLFKLVSGFWENNISSNGSYHVNLLKRMVLVIEGIRPALLSETCYKHLNELRGFRHVFRHAYSYGLDDERVIFLLRNAIQNEKGVMDDIRKFRNKIVKS